MSEPTASIGRPHLTVKGSAARLNCVDRTVRRNYQRWGLKPIATTGMLLFPFPQVEDLERRAVEGKIK